MSHFDETPGSARPENAPAENAPPAEFLHLREEERLWGMVAHLLGVLGYLGLILQYVGPLILYVIYRDTSRFVAFHALQALYFQLLLLAAGAAAGVLVFLTCGLALLLIWLFAGIASAAVVIYGLVAAVKAYDGQLFEYPIVGAMARRHVGI